MTREVLSESTVSIWLLSHLDAQKPPAKTDKDATSDIFEPECSDQPKTKTATSDWTCLDLSGSNQSSTHPGV
jgi:hypothetical protein